MKASARGPAIIMETRILRTHTHDGTVRPLVCSEVEGHTRAATRSAVCVCAAGLD